jgi:predicted lipase
MPRKRKTEAQQARQFALTLPVVLAVLAALAYWRGHSGTAIGLVSAIPVVLVIAFVLPPVWLRFFQLWMLLGQGCLG